MKNYEQFDSNGPDFVEDINGLTQYAPETGVELEGMFQIPGANLGRFVVLGQVEVNTGE